MLDVSCNKISFIPPSYRHINSLEVLKLEHNPLEMPPAQVRRKKGGKDMTFASRRTSSKYHKNKFVIFLAPEKYSIHPVHIKDLLW